MDESKRERGGGGRGKEADHRGILFPSPTSTQCTCCDQTLSLVGSNFVSLFLEILLFNDEFEGCIESLSL